MSANETQRLRYELEMARRAASEWLRIRDNAKMDLDNAEASLRLARKEVDRLSAAAAQSSTAGSGAP